MFGTIHAVVVDQASPPRIPDDFGMPRDSQGMHAHRNFLSTRCSAATTLCQLVPVRCLTIRGIRASALATMIVSCGRCLDSGHGSFEVRKYRRVVVEAV